MKAEVRKEMVSLKTYPFSDPDPVPEFGRLYPYNRFDGYTEEGTDMLWEMIVLENDYIKVWVNPSAGGKVWGAVEKCTGREFIYFNHSAKFRDLAMRGPWTSGGIEINIGIIGHSPSCAAKVDYDIRTNADGSVSCFIGATDWPSRSRWFVEICLPDRAACFIMRTSWNNNSREAQAYYNWSNAAVKTSGGLQYIFPGSDYLGHDGKCYAWPTDSENRDISFYDNNNFGHHKSYHVFGAYSNFWGCYWQKDDFGLGHYSPYEQKPGKKIWIWDHSPYGRVWEDLLTDQDGQYTEVQSGGMFNQSVSSSSRTPFKHRSFLPYDSGVWEEYWMPVKDTGGLSYSCPWLSFFIENKDDGYELKICANQPLHVVLKLEDNQGPLVVEPVEMQTMESRGVMLPRKPVENSLKLWMDDSILFDAGEQKQILKRPTQIPEGYDYDSVEGLYYQAKEWERQRFYARALEMYEACLNRDPNYTRALIGLGGLEIRLMNYSTAMDRLLTALSIDSYDAEANYLYGLVNERLGHYTDAKDGFSVAGQSALCRSAAFTELARISIRERQFDAGYSYLVKALEFNCRNSQAYQLQVLIKRKRGMLAEAAMMAAKGLDADPLDHLLRFEMYKSGHLENTEACCGKITGEMPHETYIELASLYAGVHYWQDAYEVLCLSPASPMVELWKSYAHFQLGNNRLCTETLEEAVLMNPGFVFPHRYEDIEILLWASARHNSWKLKFYLALAFIQIMREEEALNLLNACGDEPSFYPFYQVRAQVRKPSDPLGAEADLIKSCETAPDEWRTYRQLSGFYSEREDWVGALSAARTGYGRAPNYHIGLCLAKSLIAAERPAESVALMKSLSLLPREGDSEGRQMWREANLYVALCAILEKDWESVLEHISAARKWPGNMGMGKPYDVDERLEDFMEQVCLAKQHNSAADSLSCRILSFRERYPDAPFGSVDLLNILALRKAGQNGRLSEYKDQLVRNGNRTLPVRWCIAFLEGDLEKLESLSILPVPPSVVLPYEIPYEDREFPFIKRLYYMGLLEQQ